MAKRKFSIVGIIFGGLNALVAFVPPIVNTLGIMYVLAEPHFPFRHVDLGPPIWQHVRRDLPAYKAEVIGTGVCNAFLSLMLIGGAVGMGLNQAWGRWLTVGTALTMILMFCIHDIYQLGVVRPSLQPVIVRNLPPGPPGEAEGAQIGFVISWFFWCWVNMGIMVYLIAMSITVALVGLLAKPPAGDQDRERDREQDRERDRDRDRERDRGRRRRYDEYDDDR